MLKEASEQTDISMSRLVEKALWLAYGDPEGLEPQVVSAKFECRGCERFCKKQPEYLRCPRPGWVKRIDPPVYEEPSEG